MFDVREVGGVRKVRLRRQGRGAEEAAVSARYGKCLSAESTNAPCLSQRWRQVAANRPRT